MPFAAADVATVHTTACKPPWVNRVICCWMATNDALSWDVSVVSADTMLSFVAWEVNFFDNVCFVFGPRC